MELTYDTTKSQGRPWFDTPFFPTIQFDGPGLLQFQRRRLRIQTAIQRSLYNTVPTVNQRIGQLSGKDFRST
jgi:hypothetical protein